MKITRFEDIKCWQEARQLTQHIYQITLQKSFVTDFELKDQIRGAAGSIMHNIAEGFDAGSTAEFSRFLCYAQRSCSEVQSQLYVALDQNYIDQAYFAALYEQTANTKKMIGGFIKYLKNASHPKP